MDIARRHHVTPPTVTNNAAAIRAAGTRQPLSPVVVAEAERPSTPQDDHLGRVRIAATLGLTSPAAAGRGPAASAEREHDSYPSFGCSPVRRCILAAVGPLPLPVLAPAVARARRLRDRNRIPNTELAVALRLVGCNIDAADHWHPPAGCVPTDRNQVIVTLARGRDLTRRQMIDVFIAAGYTRSSATGRMSSSHPLFEPTGPDQYRLLTDAPTAASDDIVDQTGSLSG